MSKCVLWQPTIFCWPNFENFPCNYMLMVNYKFPTTTCPFTFLLVSQSSNLIFLTPCRTRIWHHVEGIMRFISMETHDNPSPSKIIFDDLKEAFVVEVWNSFHLLEEKPDYLHPKVKLNINVNFPWSNLWHQSNTKSMLLTTPRIKDLPLKLDDGRLFLSLEIILCNFLLL